MAQTQSEARAKALNTARKIISAQLGNIPNTGSRYHVELASIYELFLSLLDEEESE